MTAKDGPDGARRAIGVVIPCYESRSYIRATVESVLEQTRQPDAIVVIDDGSTDNPDSAIRDLVERNAHVCIVRQENSGVTAARNHGAALVHDCDFVLFLDADDELAPSMLERLVSVLEQHPTATMAWCHREYVNEHGQTVAPPPWPLGRRERRGLWRVDEVPDAIPETSFASLFAIPAINPSAAVIRMNAFGAAGRWDPDFGNGYEDIDLFLRLRLLGEVLFVPDRLVRYRRHATQSSGPGSSTYYWHQEQKLRDRWRDLASLDERERAMVLDAWRFLHRQCTLQGSIVAARMQLRKGEPLAAMRTAAGGMRSVLRSLVRHHSWVRRA